MSSKLIKCLSQKHHLSWVVLLFFIRCGSSLPEPYWTVQGPIMGTSFSVKAKPNQNVAIEELEQGVLKHLNEVDLAMSNWKESSDVSRFNQGPIHTWVEISPLTAQVIAESKDIWLKTDGVFEPTLGPLINLWGFGTAKRKGFPSEEAINQTKLKTGFAAIEMHEGKIQKTREVALNLSAIAKGFSVDYVAQYLESLGIHDYMVEVGGEIRCKGNAATGQAWRIGLEAPSSDGTKLVSVVGIKSGAVASSGDYRNHFEHEGKWYSHIIDPRTGWPIEPKVTAVSVLAENCSTADGYATAFMVLDPQRSLEICDEEGLGCLIVVRNASGNQVLTNKMLDQNKVD